MGGSLKRKREHAAEQAKADFGAMVAELAAVRQVVQRALLRLLNLAWPGAIHTSMIVETTRFEDAIQRLTQGPSQEVFCEQMMNILLVFIWDTCRILEERNAVLFQKIGPLQTFVKEDISEASIERVHAKLAEVSFCSRILSDLKRDLDQKLQPSPFQQALLDRTQQDLEFGELAQQCIDLALRDDSRLFLSAESARVFFEALQIAALRPRLADFRTEIDQSVQRLGNTKVAYVTAYDSYNEDNVQDDEG